MEPLKNLINKKVVTKISNELYRADSTFNQKQFLKSVEKTLELLELKGRVDLVSQKIYENYQDNLRLGIESMIKATKSDELTGFELWPFSHFVSSHAIGERALSFKLLEEVTKRFTAEFGVRAFLIDDWNQSLKVVKKWVEDDNHHLRRLASEGTRPLLPWGQKLKEVEADLDKTWWIIEALKDDDSEYVRKSVANHINDHSKKFPKEVISRLKKWDTKKAHLFWIIKHGLRTQIKNANPEALALIGVSAKSIKIVDFDLINKKVKLGETLKLKTQVSNLDSRAVKVVVDCEVHLLKKNGSYNIKCFKGKSVELKSKESLEVFINIPFKIVTTRTYYQGIHHVNLLVNGKKSEVKSFNLKTKE